MGISFIAYNGHIPTTAAWAKVTTGTSIKTLMQLSTPATAILRVKEWGISFDGSVAATPGMCELIQTDVAGTVTAYNAADLQLLNEQSGPASLLTLGTSNSGFTCTSEGSITATRTFDAQLLPPTAPYVKQWPLGEYPQLPVSKFLRIRTTFAAAINALCYIVWEEN